MKFVIVFPPYVFDCYMPLASNVTIYYMLFGDFVCM